MIEIGIKSDPIETRYRFEWLFSLMNDLGVKYVQIGSFFELYTINLSYFIKLKELADKKNIIIKSVFTAHRELGGFFYGNIHMEKVARHMYERLIEVAALLQADFCGSNPGAVYRDTIHLKDRGIQCYIKHMKELSVYAKELGLKGLTVEPMSSMAEPPTSVTEIESMMTELNAYHLTHPDTTVPFFLCADISHGLADVARNIVHSNYEIFQSGFPWMCEFHFKNTDKYFESTFGFSDKEMEKGIVDLQVVKNMLDNNQQLLPVKPITGYLEIGGPKIGRDYSDHLLAGCLTESITTIKKIFNNQS